MPNQTPNLNTNHKNNFFKTLFFRGSYEYGLLILYFWFLIAYLIILFLANYFPFNSFLLDTIYGIRNIAYIITLLLSLPVIILIPQDFLQKVKIIECGGGVGDIGLCLPNPFFLLITSFIVVFFVNFFIVLIIKKFKGK